MGVRYNLKLSQLAKEIDWKDAKSSRYAFLHGLLTGDHKGTCASMPVLYMAVGQRLGYPLKLVCVQSHIFLRWEDDKERVNLEASGPGLSIHTDEHYRKKFKFTSEDNKNKYYLKSLNPTEEYALFLEFRADILLYNRNDNEAKRIYEKILEYVPKNPYVKKRLREIASNKAWRKIQKDDREKTKLRQEQLKGAKLVAQTKMQLQMQFNQRLIEINNKYQKVSLNPTSFLKFLFFNSRKVLYFPVVST